MNSAIHNYIESSQKHLQPIIKKLRSCILAVSDDIEESIKWRVPTYSANGHICSIMTHKNHVNLQLFKGDQIESSAVLHGAGKNMRHIKFQNPEEIIEEPIIDVIQQAIKLNT